MKTTLKWILAFVYWLGIRIGIFRNPNAPITKEEHDEMLRAIERLKTP